MGDCISIPKETDVILSPATLGTADLTVFICLYKNHSSMFILSPHTSQLI